MYDPKPTVGRIVHYRLLDADIPVPACVVEVDVLDPEVLGLHVMHPRHKTPEGQIVQGGCFHAAMVKKGGGAGQWGWPPRA